MTRPYGGSDKRFSIDDAFEEETDEAIRVYGSSGDRLQLQNKHIIGDYLPSKPQKCDDTTSKDSDSLIHEYVDSSTQDTYCWNHPKVRENWKTVFAAVTLLIVGVGLLGMGAFAVAEPENGLQGAVFFVAGMICFVPGAYHVVYIWLAARGQRGGKDTSKTELTVTIFYVQILQPTHKAIHPLMYLLLDLIIMFFLCLCLMCQ